MTSFDDLNSDSYKPPVLKQSLAQWDNYQIHDLYCIDLACDSVTVKDAFYPFSEYWPQARKITVSPPNLELQSLLAVERVSPEGVIKCDWEAIANQYNGNL